MIKIRSSVQNVLTLTKSKYCELVDRWPSQSCELTFHCSQSNVHTEFICSKDQDPPWFRLPPPDAAVASLTVTGRRCSSRDRTELPLPSMGVTTPGFEGGHRLAMPGIEGGSEAHHVGERVSRRALAWAPGSGGEDGQWGDEPGRAASRVGRA
ncbi:hypothetical protein Droror1_Dr00013596 [Drosera rotundifolia]